MIKSRKVRLYPTKEQEQLMWKHIGCCRYIWNYMLDLQQKRYNAGEKHLSAFDMINLLKPLKNDGEHDWLYDVSNKSLETVCRDLAKAYNGLFKHVAKHPKFKSKKRAKPSFPIRGEKGSFYFADKYVQIQKLGKVRYKGDPDIPQGKEFKFTNPRISRVGSKWILSFGMECENQASELTDKKMGIDLGVKDLAVVAYGDEKFVFHNINKSFKMRNLRNQIRYTQHSISRKYEVSHKRTGKYTKTRNIEREEEKFRRLHRKATNIRDNHLHQTTHTLVSILPATVTMEDLNVAGMMKNKHLARSIAEQKFFEFARQMEYKCEYLGIPLQKADRFYPSSKTCSCCGLIKKDLKLTDRVFQCECGYTEDRDFNAALNLQRYIA